MKYIGAMVLSLLLFLFMPLGFTANQGQELIKPAFDSETPTDPGSNADETPTDPGENADETPTDNDGDNSIDVDSTNPAINPQPTLDQSNTN